MNTINSLTQLKEQLSEETFTNIEEIILLELFDRPDLIDDILKVTTGKTADLAMRVLTVEQRFWRAVRFGRYSDRVAAGLWIEAAGPCGKLFPEMSEQ